MRQACGLASGEAERNAQARDPPPQDGFCLSESGGFDRLPERNRALVLTATCHLNSEQDPVYYYTESCTTVQTSVILAV